MRLVINNRQFEFSETALAELNKVLARPDVTPLREKYNKHTESYDVEADEAASRQIVAVITSAWK